jgi:low temperature requirement protein LtrA
VQRRLLRYGSLAVVAPVVVLIGAFFHGHGREGLWALAAAINLLAGMRAGGGEWAINPVHFAERHALFVIIALGEVLVAAGGSASSIGLDGRTVLALIVCVAVACMLWWAYFAFIPEVGEHRLRAATGQARGVLARDFYTFGHFPLVFGLVLYAVVVKHLVPPERPSAARRSLAARLSVVFFVGGLLAFQWRAVRRLAPERVAAIPVAAGLCALGSVLPALVIVAAVAVTYSVMTAITWHRYRATR